MTANTIVGFRVDAVDETLGHVDDVIGASEAGLGARDGIVVVDMDHVDLGVKRLVPGRAIGAVDAAARVVRLTCDSRAVRAAPEMKPDLSDIDTLLDKVVRHYFG